MQFIGVIVVLIGTYLLNSAIKNRPPVGTIQALIDDPSDLVGTLSKLNGTWTTVGTADTFGTGGAGGSFDAADSKGVSVAGETGHLKDSDLVALSFAKGQRLVPEAAAALESLNQAYKMKFGKNISVTDSYRSYSQQVSTKAAKGNLAATPGKSVHGLGKAVDLGGGIQNFGTAQYNFMLEAGPAFGWVAPSWARKGGSKPEPWHFEYTGGK